MNGNEKDWMRLNGGANEWTNSKCYERTYDMSTTYAIDDAHDNSLHVLIFAYI